MEEQNKVVSEAVEELKNADETQLKEVIEKWFESARTQGLKIGAQMISSAIYGIIQKHLKKAAKNSLNDYRRCVKEIINLISIQLTKQNDLDTENITDEQESGI